MKPSRPEAPKVSIFADVDPIPHTTLGQSADLILVCPATARIISDCRTARSARPPVGHTDRQRGTVGDLPGDAY
ncbi:MAG: hypothetical protein R2706_12750 [Acidimicrobiales bacterium]